MLKTRDLAGGAIFPAPGPQEKRKREREEMSDESRPEAINSPEYYVIMRLFEAHFAIFSELMAEMAEVKALASVALDLQTRSQSHAGPHDPNPSRPRDEVRAALESARAAALDEARSRVEALRIDLFPLPEEEPSNLSH